MIPLATFTTPEEAHLFRSYLAAEGIEAFIFDESIAQLCWHYSNAIGGVRVVVFDTGEEDFAENVDAACRNYMSALRSEPALSNTVRAWPIVLLLSLFFGIPCLLFGRRPPATDQDEAPANHHMMQRFLNHKITAITFPAFIGLGGGALSIRVFEQYGWSLFLGLPILVSFLAALCWSYKQRRSFASAYGVSCLSIVLLGGLIILFSLDGLFCLIMALPLSLVLALIGAALGRALGSSFDKTTTTTIASLLCMSFPLLVGFEHATAPTPAVRKVTTSVLIDAPIEKVWDTVIAFPEITEPPQGIFRFGIAYPINAVIEGRGVGAIRYCRFSTGDFVEPITEWSPPHRLCFDVTESPLPMKELSLYDDLHAPHLHGHMESKKGQFVLKQSGNQVLLEGTTWYSHSIAPEFYWGLISDEIIHRIHLRVLNHIKHHTEKQ